MKEEENVISLTLTDTGTGLAFVDSRTQSYEASGDDETKPTDISFRGPRVEMIFSAMCLYANFKMSTP